MIANCPKLCATLSLVQLSGGNFNQFYTYHIHSFVGRHDRHPGQHPKNCTFTPITISVHGMVSIITISKASIKRRILISVVDNWKSKLFSERGKSEGTFWAVLSIRNAFECHFQIKERFKTKWGGPRWGLHICFCTVNERKRSGMGVFRSLKGPLPLYPRTYMFYGAVCLFHSFKGYV